MTQPFITINNDKTSEFEFDVAIQGVPASEANVRFVIEAVRGYDVTINCVQKANHRWLANIPALQLGESNQKFRVEVIAGGYYFCPTSGTMKVVTNPKVGITEILQKDQGVKVSATVGPTGPQLVMLEAMASEARLDLFKRCRAAGKIFARAGEMMQASIAEQKKFTAQSLVEVMEAVKKAIRLIEVKVYLG